MSENLTEKLNMEKLYRLAREGRPAREIMQELDLTDMADLNNALINLMHEKKEDIQIPGLSDEAGISPRYTGDGIRISPAMLSECRFAAGDEFTLRVEGDKITLRKKS